MRANRRPPKPSALWGIYMRHTDGAPWEEIDKAPTKPMAEQVARQLRAVGQVLVWRADRTAPATAMFRT